MMSEKKEIITQIEQSLMWRFEPTSSIDAPYHSLISHIGVDAIMHLDTLMQLTPVPAAQEATRYFYIQSIELGIQPVDQVKAELSALMQSFQEILKKNAQQYGLQLREGALLPPESVYKGDSDPVAEAMMVG